MYWFPNWHFFLNNRTVQIKGQWLPHTSGIETFALSYIILNYNNETLKCWKLKQSQNFWKIDHNHINTNFRNSGAKTGDQHHMPTLKLSWLNDWSRNFKRDTRRCLFCDWDAVKSFLNKSLSFISVSCS